jgi:shikimate dehydrogenase
VTELGFVGVTTGQSSIRRIFPAWARELGLGEASIRGWDIALHAPAAAYRAAVEEILSAEDVVGALVTTHKIDLYDACRDRFDVVDELAELCGEVSCLAKRDGALCAWAKDPITAGRTLDAMLDGRDLGSRGGHVLCLGAGGAAIATSVHLLRLPEASQPERLTFVDRAPERLDALHDVHERLGAPADRVRYVHNEAPERNDRLMAELPPGSLVVNATGMGKDRPGSPITDRAPFPEQGLAWELNYRGALRFLAQAREAAAGTELAVHDGWTYFIHGWAAVIEEVYRLSLGPDDVRSLDAVARRVVIRGT